MALRPTTAVLAASLACMIGTVVAQHRPSGPPPPRHAPPPEGMPPPPPHGMPPPPPHHGHPPPPPFGHPPPHQRPAPPPALHPADGDVASEGTIAPARNTSAQAPLTPTPPAALRAADSPRPSAASYAVQPPPPSRTADAVPTPQTDASALPSPWLLPSLLAALVLMMLGWWRARRHGSQLAERARKLDRDQRLLKSAHQTLKAHSERLQEQSTLDPLTGVLNRQAFATEFRESIAHLSRFDRPVNLIVFDLDHFKSINDRQGHLAGDAALKLVVGIVREHLVSADLFGRFGGDEFLIACADQPLAACRDLAERIRAAVQTRAATAHPPLAGLTLSMGIAQADGETGYTPDALFARADAALYEAKRRGRNRVVVADNTTPDLPANALHARHL